MSEQRTYRGVVWQKSRSDNCLAPILWGKFHKLRGKLRADAAVRNANQSQYNDPDLITIRRLICSEITYDRVSFTVN